jgi:hypothetical protein
MARYLSLIIPKTAWEVFASRYRVAVSPLYGFAPSLYAASYNQQTATDLKIRQE